MIDCAERYPSTDRIYLWLAAVVSTGSVAVAEAPRISRIRDGTIGEALAVLRLRVIVRGGMRMWTTIVGHVEALRKASRDAMRH